MLEFKVYVTNLAKYNEGKLVGKWVDFPTYGSLDEIVEEILGDDEEFFITDYENNIGYEVGEYENVFELDEILEEVDSLSEYDFNKLKALLEGGIVGDLGETLNQLDNYILMEGIKDEYDLGYYLICEAGVYDIPDKLQCYIDYERFGRDAGMDGYFSSYGYIEEC